MSGRIRRDIPGLRPAGMWPEWLDDILHEGPLGELEPEWKAGIGDAITRELDIRAGTVEVYNCPQCGAGRCRKAVAS